MRTLKALSRAHGGKYTVQSGINPGETRDYWLIMESFHTPAAGGITRSAQIHRSWAMQQQLAEGAWRTLAGYSLVYVTEGGGRFRDERHKADLPVSAGDVICLFPGIAHAYGPPAGERWNEINLEFSGPVFDAWMGVGLLDPAQPVRRLGPAQVWLRRFYDVVQPLAKRGAEQTLRDAGRLVALIAGMCATWQTPRQDGDVEWAGRARARLLAMPPEETLDLVKEARRFGIGEQAYRKKFRRLCGITPTLFRSRHLVELACHRLISGHESVKTIGLTSGFGSEFYFSRRFKQITGMSPGEYRRRALG
ncbi:DNA-binding domain-containing protein, AraC-type [Opitutaceae bacterium TAV1]|nr:DNA-binding domain-containing protein, AraC-type [Opitutaceae bacterium TAV1]